MVSQLTFGWVGLRAGAGTSLRLEDPADSTLWTHNSLIHQESKAWLHHGSPGAERVLVYLLVIGCKAARPFGFSRGWAYVAQNHLGISCCARAALSSQLHYYLLYYPCSGEPEKSHACPCQCCQNDDWLRKRVLFAHEHRKVLICFWQAVDSLGELWIPSGSPSSLTRPPKWGLPDMRWFY